MAGFSIRNPFFIIVCCLMIAIVGTVAVVRMPVNLRHSLRCEPFPQNLAALPVDAENAPLLTGRIGPHVDRPFGGRLEKKVLIGADRSGEK